MNTESIVISSRIRLARNLNNIPFPTRLNEKLAKEVIDGVTSSIINSNSYISKDFSILNLSNMKDYEKVALVEKHLISKEILDSNTSEVLINSDETVSIMINEEDHIRLQVIEDGFNIEKSFDIADKIDNLMEEKLNYAFDNSVGYLTSCITNIGTGMRASIMMHLPALSRTNTISSLSKVISKYGMTIRGLYGEGTEGFGNIYQVSNQVSLGISEKDIIKNLSIVVRKIIDSEFEKREYLRSSGVEEFDDRIFRSLGILKYSKLISSIDALNLISNVRCGIEMGILKDIDLKDIKYATESIQSGNIQRILSRKMTSRERDIERAKILNKVFK